VRDVAFITSGTKNYGSEGSAAVPARPSDEGMLKSRVFEAKIVKSANLSMEQPKAVEHFGGF
jgi:hypothetical protein